MDWISLKKEYPKDNQPVICTVENKDKRNVVILTYNKFVNEETGEITNMFIDGNGDCFGNKITAWMELPEPYEDVFRVIVAGSRTFDDYDLLKVTLDKIFSLHKPTAIVCGEARGADILGKRYAKEHGIHVNSFPANWSLHGKSAGYLRNEEMAKNAEACVCFWDGKSNGTKHMIDTAKKSNLQVRVIKY